MGTPHVLAVILARAGSKGLPQKNVHPVAGRPMIAWTIDAVAAANRVDAVCVTTDLPEAATIARDAGLIVIDRPPELATDTASVAAAARRAVAEFERTHGAASHVVLLYANIPVRAPGIIDAAVEKLIATGADSVRSVSPVGKHHPDWLHRLDGDRMIQYRVNSIHRRQDLEPLYHHDGAVIAVTRDSLFVDDADDPHAFFGKDRRAVVSMGATIDVDSIDDARLAESVLQARVSGEVRAPGAPRIAGPTIRIGSSNVGATSNPYVIAEIGVNHDGRIDTAKSLIDAARAAGADAIKLQIFDAARLAGAAAATCAYQRKSEIAESSQRAMLRRLELSRDEFEQLRAYCERIGVDFLATPFGPPELEFLANVLNPAAVKLASPDLVNHPLLDAAAKTGLPLIVSTGAGDWDEIVAAVARLRSVAADGRLALLHCISAYPTPLEQANLAVIDRLRRAFALPVGFSDHTTEIDVGALAVAAGARILEKHLTHDRGAAGPDHAVSLEPAAFAEYVARARRAALALGSDERHCLDIEQEVRRTARGRIVASRRIPAGTRITAEALMVQRPGDGISPSEFNRCVGTWARTEIAPETPLHWDMIESRR